MRNRILTLALAALTLTACSPAPAAKPVDTAAIATQAHDAYVGAINSNDVDTLMDNLTDDVVYQAPNMPEVVGKPAVRAWVAEYFAAYQMRWEKTSREFIVVSDDWAFERYAYRSTDTNKATGAVTVDEGKGLNVYHRDADGRWRVARDAWSSNGKPAPAA